MKRIDVIVIVCVAAGAALLTVPGAVGADPSQKPRLPAAVPDPGGPKPVASDRTPALGEKQPQALAEAYDKGLAFFAKGDFDSAIAAFTDLIRLDPKPAAAYCSRGAAYSRKGDYDKAIADCTRSIRLDPKCRRHSIRGAPPTQTRAT